MSHLSQETLLTNLINTGNELILLAKNASIYRASIAYMFHHIHPFLVQVKNISSKVWTPSQFQAVQHLQELFNHFGNLLSHLSVERWIQPALNWPADYVHKYIDGFRKSFIDIIPSFGFNVTDIFVFDESQEVVNKRADIQSLRSSLQALMAQVDTSDAVGVQQQIETKLAEIKQLLPQDSRRNRLSRRPSCDSMPIVQMQKRVEELLSQYKSISIPLDDIQLQTQIGVGGYGTVYKATRLSTGEVVAVKELRNDRLTMSSWASLYAEVETMASVRHQFVLELVGAHITEPYRIITRFCPGKSLFDRIHRIPKNGIHLTPTELTKIAYQVALGMSHLHSLNIVHRDLKSLNILLNEHNDGLVADFGLSGMMKNNQELVGGVGTPHYTAPEVLMHSSYGPKVDVFSFGVVLWEMLMKRVPYADMSHTQIYEHVVNNVWRLPIPNDAPEGIKRLITRCWNHNPTDRPEFSEIVNLFEKGTVYFNDSEKLDFDQIKKAKHSPPIDFAYALNVLSNPLHDNFSTLIYFLVYNIDEKIRLWLRDIHIMTNLVSSNNNIDSILLLASVTIDSIEISDFLTRGGLNMFRSCIELRRGPHISAAMKFGLQVPDSLLPLLKEFLPSLIDFINPLNGNTNDHILQFLTRYTSQELEPYMKRIGDCIINVSKYVNDQQTFDAIMYLTQISRHHLQLSQLHSLYKIIAEDFVVTAPFLETLIGSNDVSCRHELLYYILKATAKSDVTQVLLEFIVFCQQQDPSIFSKIVIFPDLISTLQSLLETGLYQGSLMIIYSMSRIDDFRTLIMNSHLLQLILQIKKFTILRIQIFTFLCLNEQFCSESRYIDGIIHILVGALSNKDHVNAAVRLIAALSSHSQGVQVLTNNDVLELFSQLFLSSNSGDISTSLTVLRNVANFGEIIPQISLIISCLMQDIMSDPNRRIELLETVFILLTTMPLSVQEHDLQTIILPHITVSENPRIVFFALKIFSTCDSSKIKGFNHQLLRSIHSILSNHSLAYPQIIEECMNVLFAIHEHNDISTFISQTDMSKYLIHIQKIMNNSQSTILQRAFKEFAVSTLQN